MKYTVILQKENNTYTATVPALPGCRTEGATEQDALENIRTQIAEMLSRTRIVSVEVDAPQIEGQAHPWKNFAGMWKDDATFDDFLSEVEAERRRTNTKNETA